MATVTVTRGNTLPNSSQKADFHNLIDQATGSVSNIVNADIDAAAAIADTKLAQITTADKVSIAAVTKASNLTTVTAVSGDYVVISDTSDSGNTKKALVSDLTFTPSASNALAGSVVQIKNTPYTTMSTGTTAIPNDDTVPQNTEGDQYFTLAITPNSATNKLLIRAWAYVSHTSGSISQTMALFQDSTASALNCGFIVYTATTQYPCLMYLEHFMDAGTTSATTFKIRIGGATGATTTVNGINGARRLGGTLTSGMTIEEIKV